MSKREEKIQIDVDGIPVCITRKKVKNLTMRVAQDGSGVCISLPLRAPQSDAVRFVRQKRTWIDAHLAKASTSLSAVAANATQKEIATWYAQIGKDVPPLIAQWEKRIGVTANTVVYRNMKSRWGSCQPKTGRICINVRLALYPPECLEYVVVHELCHLLERGHGQRFKALMDEFLPDWRSRRALLR